MALLVGNKAVGRQRTKDSVEGAGMRQPRPKMWLQLAQTTWWSWSLNLCMASNGNTAVTSAAPVIVGYFFICGHFFCLWWTQENTSFCLADITAGIYSEYLKNHTVWQGSDCSLSWLLLYSWSPNIFSLWMSMKNRLGARWIIIWLYVASLAHNMMHWGAILIFQSLLHFC